MGMGGKIDSRAFNGELGVYRRVLNWVYGVLP